MARTLLCLVASMTFGAAVLSWGEPTRPAAKGPAIRLIARGNAATPVWQGIQIDPYHTNNTPYNGKTSPATSHFVIDRTGKCVTTETWQSDQRSGLTGLIRVGLEASAPSNAITVAQWAATRQLIRSLQQTYNIPGQRVAFSDMLAVPPAPSPSSSTARLSPHTSRSPE